MSTNLTGWIEQKVADKGWTLRELSRRSGLSSGTISDVLSGRANPGVQFCNKISKALDIPAERVFREAGILPPVIIGEERERELLDFFRNLDISDQNRLITIARTFYEQRTTNDTEPISRTEE